MTKIVWTDRAEKDLLDILEYIASDNPMAAHDFVDNIIERTEKLLGTTPRAGRPGRVENTREWVAHENYIIVYQLAATEVQILTVRHSQRL